jgi:hypothetical protein
MKFNAFTEYTNSSHIYITVQFEQVVFLDKWTARSTSKTAPHNEIFYNASFQLVVQNVAYM